MGQVFPDCPLDLRLAGGIWEKKKRYLILFEFESEFVGKIWVRIREDMYPFVCPLL